MNRIHGCAWLLAGLIGALVLSSTAERCFSAEVHWQPVPMRTAEQKQQGHRGGEMGQMCYTMAISPSDPQQMALGIDTAATYLSTDGGKTWAPKHEGILSNGVQSVAFDPRNPRILWAAGLRSVASTPEPGVPSAAELPRYVDRQVDGIYRTTDGGEHWELIRPAVFLRRQTQNQYFAFDPTSFDGTECTTIYAATHWEGLLKSSDGGHTWRRLGFEKTFLCAVIAGPQDPQRLYVATETALYRSDDAGEHFRKVGGGLPRSTLYGLAVHSRNQDIVYVAMGMQGVWWSRDGGETFARRDNGLRRLDWRRLALSPADPQRLYVEGNRIGGMSHLYWAHDGGASWHPMEKIEPGFTGGALYFAEGVVAHPRDPDVAFLPQPVRKTTDGGRTWVYSSDGISGFRRATRTSIAFRPDDPRKMVLFHLDHGSALTDNGGDTFVYIPPPRQKDLGAITTAVGAYDPTPGSKKLVSAVGGWTQQRICISEDDGATWSVQSNNVGNYRFLAFHPQRPNIVYAGRYRDGLRSDDGGRTWTRLPYSIDALFPGNGDLVFAIATSKETKHRFRVLKSSDRGNTWIPLSDDLPGFPGEIDVDPRNPNRLYVAADTGVWIFNGRKWEVRDERHGLERTAFGGLCFDKIAVDPVHPNIVYAGQRQNWRGLARGVFRSVDYGEHWENINGNLGRNLTVWAITVSPHDGTVWLGTDYGNWKLPAPASNPAVARLRRPLTAWLFPWE